MRDEQENRIVSHLDIIIGELKELKNDLQREHQATAQRLADIERELGALEPRGVSEK